MDRKWVNPHISLLSFCDVCQLRKFLKFAAKFFLKCIGYLQGNVEVQNYHSENWEKKIWELILSHSILQILSLDVMGQETHVNVLTVVAPIQILVEFLREIVIMMMIVEDIFYAAQTTVSIHSHHQ